MILHSEIHSLGWTEKEWHRLESVDSFAELAGIALTVMDRRSHGLHMVSGPITTGGLGSRELNMKVFISTIEHLHLVKRVPVFSQIPFETRMKELADRWMEDNPDAEYCQPILDIFYERIFVSGLVSTLHFIHGYESSYGARWEHAGCDRWGIERRYLSEVDSQACAAG